MFLKLGYIYLKILCSTTFLLLLSLSFFLSAQLLKSANRARRERLKIELMADISVR